MNFKNLVLKRGGQLIMNAIIVHNIVKNIMNKCFLINYYLVTEYSYT